MQKAGLQQTLSQTTKLSPTQIMTIRLLELPSIELHQRITEELQENPALEEGRDETQQVETIEDDYNEYNDYDLGEEDSGHDPLQNEDFNYEQYVSDDETPDYMLRQQYNPVDEDRREVPIIGGTSLIEELKSQIYLTHMTKEQRHIAKWVLGNIDDDGYLRRSIELQKLLNTTKQEQQDVARKQVSELKKAEKRKEELDRRFLKVYEDWSDERITESNFKMLSQKYQAEQQETEEKIARLKASMAEEKQTVADTEKWINLIRQYAAPTELTADLLNTLIEKILIHEPVKVMKGLNEQEIEIFYRFVGKID